MILKTLSTDCRKGEDQLVPGSGLDRRVFLASAAKLLAAGTMLTSSVHSLAQNSNTPLEDIKALTFDVFGTVVDWRGSIIREGQLLQAKQGIQANWGDFADAWRRGYGPAMNKVRSGEMPWTKIDDLHRMILNNIAADFGLDALPEDELQELNRAWHRLSPWPDTVAGLHRLKSRFLISTLSNGNVSLLTHMAKNAGLPWDAVLSAELSGHYKPDPEAYLKAAELLSLQPSEILMVAAHPSDLRAAARTGMRTAYVVRPLERGPERAQTIIDNLADNSDFDLVVHSFIELAEALGA